MEAGRPGGYIGGIRSSLCRSPQVVKSAPQRNWKTSWSQGKETRDKAQDGGRDHFQQFTGHVKKCIGQHPGSLTPLFFSVSLMFVTVCLPLLCVSFSNFAWYHKTSLHEDIYAASFFFSLILLSGLSSTSIISNSFVLFCFLEQNVLFFYFLSKFFILYWGIARKIPLEKGRSTHSSILACRFIQLDIILESLVQYAQNQMQF